MQVLLGDHDITTDNETQSLRVGVSSLELHPQYDRWDGVYQTSILTYLLQSDLRLWRGFDPSLLPSQLHLPAPCAANLSAPDVWIPLLICRGSGHCHWLGHNLLQWSHLRCPPGTQYTPPLLLWTLHCPISRLWTWVCRATPSVWAPQCTPGTWSLAPCCVPGIPRGAETPVRGTQVSSGGHIFLKSKLSPKIGRVVCSTVFQPIRVHHLCSNPIRNGAAYNYTDCLW